jgi:hypothetical protein
MHVRAGYWEGSLGPVYCQAVVTLIEDFETLSIYILALLEELASCLVSAFTT